jgi:hypothetical protein
MPRLLVLQLLGIDGGETPARLSAGRARPLMQALSAQG